MLLDKYTIKLIRGVSLDIPESSSAAVAREKRKVAMVRNRKKNELIARRTVGVDVVGKDMHSNMFHFHNALRFSIFISCSYHAFSV